MIWIKSKGGYLALLGAAGLVAFAVFTLLISKGQPSGPGVFLAFSVVVLLHSGRLLFQSARMLVLGGVEADAVLAVGRRRKELEREYQVVKRALKELELDRAMGKVSEEDYQEVRARYRERAIRLMRQLDEKTSYRAQIEQDLKARRAARGEPAVEVPAAATAAAPAAEAGPKPSPKDSGEVSGRHRGKRKGRSGKLAGLLAFLALLAALRAGAQPAFDPAQMSGIPRPDPAVAARTVTVRLIRGDMQHPLPDQEVELASLSGGTPLKARSDKDGRATFAEVPLGTYEARASTDGEALASQPIEIPESPGVRVMLVFSKSIEEQQKELGTPDGKARVDQSLPTGTLVLKAVDEQQRPLKGLKASLHHADRQSEKVEALADQTTDDAGVARWTGLKTGAGDGYMAGVEKNGSALRSKPLRLDAKHGSQVVLLVREVVKDRKALVLDAESHLILQFNDDMVQVVENLFLKNPLEQAVDPGPEGVRIPLAEGALSAQVQGQGENSKVSIDVSRPGVPPQVVWRGIVPPGVHPVQAGFLLRHSGDVSVKQELALPMERLLIGVTKLPAVKVSGRGLRSNESRIEGRDWILVSGEPPKAGDVLEFTVEGIPYQGPLYRMVAGLLALAVALAFGVAAWRGQGGDREEEQQQQREALNKRREALLQRILDAERSPQGESRRTALVAELEQVYRDLDQLEG